MKAITERIPRATLAGLLVPCEDERTTVEMPPLRLEELLAPQRSTAVIHRPRRRREPKLEASYAWLLVVAGFSGGVALGLLCLWL